MSKNVSYACLNGGTQFQAAKRRALKMGDAIPLGGDEGDEAKRAERAEHESAELERAKVKRICSVCSFTACSSTEMCKCKVTAFNGKHCLP